MKRRRRIEITRYSRRITILRGEPAASDAAAEQQAGDLILEMLDGIPPTRADCDGSVYGDVAADYLPGRRPFSRLRDLLRMCKRG